MTNKIESVEFRDGMLIFLDYIKRKFKQTPDYLPHPLIRALEIALDGMKNVNVGECAMGVSGLEENDKYANPYVVVVEKQDKHRIEVKEITDLTTNKPLPVDVMIRVFRLQILLDKIEGETVNSEQMADVLNRIIPENHFYALGERWKEARDLFRDQIEKGKISIPSNYNYKDAFSKITYSTPWEDYPPEVRSLVGTSIAQSIDQRHGTTIITSPPKSKIDKSKVFEMAVQTIMGKSNEYFHPKDCIYCNVSLIKDYILGIRNNFIVLADKHPVSKGHMLIIPMLRVRAIGDLPKEQLLELDSIIKEINGFFVSQNKKLILFEPGFVGQSVYHAHIHCVPGDFVISEGVKALGVRVQELPSIDMRAGREKLDRDISDKAALK